MDDDLNAECHPPGIKTNDKKQNMKVGVDFEEEEVHGDQFMAVKPWLGVIKNSQPNGYKPSKRDRAAPDATLNLEYIFGYRCHDSRNNLRYTAEGKIAYHAAGVAIVLDQRTNI